MFRLRYVMLSSRYLHHHYTTTSIATPTCPSIGGPILLMSIMRVCKDVTLLEEKWDMAIHRVCKDVMLLGRGGHSYREGK